MEEWNINFYNWFTLLSESFFVSFLTLATSTYSL